MDGLSIANILRNVLGKVFKGVFSYDEWRSIPQSSHPSAYVFNTQPHYVNVGHWVAIYIKRDGTSYFFDTFGRRPDALGFLKFLEKHSSKWRYNNIIVQNFFTAVCGQHSIYFLYKIHNAKTFSWMKNYSSDLLLNDQNIYQAVKTRFHVNTDFFPKCDFLSI